MIQRFRAPPAPVLLTLSPSLSIPVACGLLLPLDMEMACCSDFACMGRERLGRAVDRPACASRLPHSPHPKSVLPIPTFLSLSVSISPISHTHTHTLLPTLRRRRSSMPRHHSSLSWPLPLLRPSHGRSTASPTQPWPFHSIPLLRPVSTDRGHPLVCPLRFCRLSS
jgi:hypothetical protein